MGLRKNKPVHQICEELLRTVGAAKDMCILAWDSGSPPAIVFARGAVTSLFQKSPDDLLGQPISSLFAGGERAAKDVTAVCQAAPACEQRPMLRGGAPFEAQLLLRGSPGSVVAIVRDLTVSQSQADARLRVDDLARFASLVAHEVRNPLSAVKIALQTLERHGTLAQNDLRRTSIALREVLNIELLLNEVLEFARPPSLSLVPADPRAAIEEGIAGVEQEWANRGVSFVRKLPDRMAPAVLDPVRLRTAVKILARQAAVAVEETGGGTVEIAAREFHEGFEIAVADTGRTLPAELREKAFVPFTPQRARGSGLGLAVVLRIAREHKGDARIDEREGGGNVISMTFAAS